MQFGRKAKSIDEMIEDRTFIWHIGQLIGAAEMASHMLSNHPEGDVQRIGDKLGEVVTWFFKDSGGKRDTKAVQNP
jgi:hypothetical protein